MEGKYSKKDWMLFRSKIGEWQENYIDRLNQEYINLLSKPDSPSEKFWELEKRIRENKHSPGVQIRMGRSDLFLNVLSLLNHGVIQIGDLDEFSPEFREKVNTFFHHE